MRLPFRLIHVEYRFRSDSMPFILMVWAHVWRCPLHFSKLARRCRLFAKCFHVGFSSFRLSFCYCFCLVSCAGLMLAFHIILFLCCTFFCLLRPGKWCAGYARGLRSREVGLVFTFTWDEEIYTLNFVQFCNFSIDSNKRMASHLRSISDCL